MSARGVLVVLVSACLPLPHLQQRSPVLDGDLSGSGQPLAQVPVHLSTGAYTHPTATLRDEPCTGQLQSVTDAHGHFHVDRTREFEFFIIFGDRLDTWQLCFELPGGQSARWGAWGFWGGPPTMNLACEVVDGQLSCLVARSAH